MLPLRSFCKLALWLQILWSPDVWHQAYHADLLSHEFTLRDSLGSSLYKIYVPDLRFRTIIRYWIRIFDARFHDDDMESGVAFLKLCVRSEKILFEECMPIGMPWSSLTSMISSKHIPIVISLSVQERVPHLFHRRRSFFHYASTNDHYSKFSYVYVEMR